MTEPIRVIPPYRVTELTPEELAEYRAERLKDLERTVLRARQQVIAAQIAVTEAKQRLEAALLTLERVREQLVEVDDGDE